MSDDSFVMEMCGNRAAWQIQVDGVEKSIWKPLAGRSKALVILLELEPSCMDIFRPSRVNPVP